MFIVTYKNDGDSSWSESHQKFESVSDAAKWIYEELPIGTQEFGTGEYEVVQICLSCKEYMKLSSSSEICNKCQME